MPQDMTQDVPEFLKQQRENHKEDKYERKRQIMRNMVGILPRDMTLEEAKEARFAAHDTEKNHDEIS